MSLLGVIACNLVILAYVSISGRSNDDIFLFNFDAQIETIYIGSSVTSSM